MAAGDTCVLPSPDTVPTPLSIEAEEPPTVRQLSIDEPPLRITGGLAVKVLTTGVSMEGGTPDTVSVVVASIEPWSLVAVNLYVVVKGGLTGCEPFGRMIPKLGSISTS